jgi:hypothetical protein
MDNAKNCSRYNRFLKRRYTPMTQNGKGKECHISSTRIIGIVCIGAYFSNHTHVKKHPRSSFSSLGHNTFHEIYVLLEIALVSLFQYLRGTNCCQHETM